MAIENLNAGLTFSNDRLRQAIRELRLEGRRHPELLYPWWLMPCKVRVLLVTDSGLDFGHGNFGLATFVGILLDTVLDRGRIEVTLAHISPNATNNQMLSSEPRVNRRITGFKFDDASHFSSQMYDQVWLFGIVTNYGASRGGNHVGDRLMDSELAVLREFMDGGGGVFATGDHGRLGRALCHAVPRAGSMRLWDDTVPDPQGNHPLNEVSMMGERRNDTNRLGDEDSQFDDQSDYIPQITQPTMYRRRMGFIWEAKFPHPLLCGPMGLIDVLPDHPHEGECIVPVDLDSAARRAEFPDGAGGSPRPLPELIARSSVLANTTSGSKAATLPQVFGAICAYDGHRANVGRVVTDATWHHFVNVNLVGNTGYDDGTPKGDGFLHTLENGTTPGQAAYEKIKAYYRNIAVWISRPATIQCLNHCMLWNALWRDQLIEAVTIDPKLTLQKTDPLLLWAIGRHARDVLGKFAGRCQTERIVLDLLWPRIPKPLFELIDPWCPIGPRPPRPEPDPSPWVDFGPVLDITLGGALVALRERFPDPNDVKLDRVEAALSATIEEGATVGVAKAMKSLDAATQAAGRMFAAPSRSADSKLKPKNPPSRKKKP